MGQLWPGPPPGGLGAVWFRARRRIACGVHCSWRHECDQHSRYTASNEGSLPEVVGRTCLHPAAVGGVGAWSPACLEMPRQISAQSPPHPRVERLKKMVLDLPMAFHAGPSAQQQYAWCASGTVDHSLTCMSYRNPAQDKHRPLLGPVLERLLSPLALSSPPREGLEAAVMRDRCVNG